MKPIWRTVRFHALRVLLTPVAWLPRGAGLRIFGALGALCYDLLPRTRRIILGNITLIHPDWDAGRRHRFGRGVLRWLGRNGFDFVRLRGYSEEDLKHLVRIEGLDHLRAAQQPGVGVICLSAHLGCWELMPARLRAEGFDVAVVYRRLRSRELHAYVTARRARHGIETLDRDTDGRRILRALQRGAVLGVLIDQRTRVDSVRVPFLGRPAWTPTGPVRLAMRSGAPVITAVAAMMPDGTHLLRIGPRIVLEPPEEGASCERAAQIIERNTARCNEALGEALRPWQDQWVWFHPRWRDV